MDPKTTQKPAPAQGEPQAPPPPYTDATSHTAGASASTHLPPAYESGSTSQFTSATSDSVAKTNAIAPYRSFPLVMSGRGSWSIAGLKSFHLTSADAKERLYIVEANFKTKAGGPLKDVPGMLLRNGTDIKDDVIAATADDNPDPTIPELVLMHGFVLLPTAGGKFRKEPVYTKVSAAEELVLRFAADRSDESGSWREEFEWVKFEKGTDSEYKAGGWRLFRKDDGSQASGSGAGGSTGAKTSRGEVLAILWWPGNLITNGTHYFDLKFSKAVEGEGLGEQWTLTAVMTALRIMFLRMSGRTHLSHIQYWTKDKKKNDPLQGRG